MKESKLAPQNMTSGDLVLDGGGKTGIITEFDDTWVNAASVFFKDGVVQKNTFYLTHHPWNDVFAFFLSVVRMAGREPERFQTAHDQLCRLLGGLLDASLK